MLTGGPGATAFLFKAGPARGHDRRSSIPADTMRLEPDAFGLRRQGRAEGVEFHVGAAHDRSDRIVYDDAGGLLIYDRNGSRPGKEKVFASIDTGLDLDSDMFIVI
jgi:hypothetical protein